MEFRRSSAPSAVIVVRRDMAPTIRSSKLRDLELGRVIGLSAHLERNLSQVTGVDARFGAFVLTDAVEYFRRNGSKWRG